MAEESSKTSNPNFILVIMLVIAAFLVGVFWTKSKELEKKVGTTTTKQQTATTGNNVAAPTKAEPKVSLSTIKGLFGKNLIKFGDVNKKLLFVEVADPSCPYCQIAAGENPQLNAQVGDRFKLSTDGGTYVSPVKEMRKLIDNGQASLIFIYQNGHGNGEMAMKSLYCANDQGKFWEAHDKLMTNDGYNLINNVVKNDKTQTDKLVSFLGNSVDSASLKSCLDSGKYDSRLTSDVQLATSLGVNGTPGFFINATNFAGAYSWTDMKSALPQN